MSQSRNFRMNVRGSESRQKPSSSKSDSNKQPGTNASSVKKHKPKSIIQFPPEQTEEELALLNKYQKLKKQKKALLKQNAPPARNEPETLPIIAGNTGAGCIGGIGGNRPRSPQVGARDAKEIAKKLVKSGTITIKKTPNPSNEGFKRPLGLERKLISTDKSVGYQPFSATVMEGYGDSIGKVLRKSRYASGSSSPFDVGGVDRSVSTEQFQRNSTTDDDDNDDRSSNSSTKNNVNSISVTSSSNADNDNSDNIQKSDKRKFVPTEGQTLHVSGRNITEEFIKEIFKTYGKIVKLLVVHDRNYSFVTLDSQEATLKALNDLNDNTINDVRLKVSFARRRMMFNSHRWSGLPGSEFQKYEDGRRDLVKYEDDIFNVSMHDIDEQNVNLPEDD